MYLYNINVEREVISIKITIFYKHNSLEDVDRDAPSIYAYTADEELAEKFMSERNMDLFIKIKKKMSTSEYKKFNNACYKYRLEIRSMYTKDPNMYGKKQIVKVLSTWGELEKISLNPDMIYKELSRHLVKGFSNYKNEYKDVLNKLAYRDARDYYITTHYNTFFQSVNNDDLVDITLDEFGMFMYFFGNTMR